MNGQQDMNYDNFCKIPNNASCSLRLNRTRRAPDGADGGRSRAESDRASAAAERSKNGRQDMNYNIISDISSIDNCSLRWNGERRVSSGADGGRERAERDGERAAAGCSKDVHYGTIRNSSSLVNSSLRQRRALRVAHSRDATLVYTTLQLTTLSILHYTTLTPVYTTLH